MEVELGQPRGGQMQALLAAGLIGLFLLGMMRRAPPAAPTGEVTVSGSIGSISLASHGAAKLPGANVTIVIPYTVSAVKAGLAVNWNYQLQVILQSAVSSTISVSVSPSLANLAPGAHTATVTLAVPANTQIGSFMNVLVTLLAAGSSGGQPTTAFSPIANGVHLSAVQIVSPEVTTSGNVGAITVSQPRGVGVSFRTSPLRGPRSPTRLI